MDNVLSHYKQLLELIVDIADEVKGDSGHPRGGFAEALLVKFIQHSVSIFELYNGTQMPISKKITVDVIDFSSVSVLCRAALESLLMLHWLILDPNDDAEAELRFLSWKLTGLLTRMKIPDSEENIQPKTKCRHEILETAIALHKNPIFMAFPTDQKEALFNTSAKGIVYKRTGWDKMIGDIGFNEIFSVSYKFRCDHAHTGFLSAVQVRDAVDKKVQKRLCNDSLQIIVMLTAKIACMYGQVFPKCQKALEQHPVYGLASAYASQACSPSEELMPNIAP